MLEEEFYISGLIAKQLQGELDSEQQRALDKWINTAEKNKIVHQGYCSEREIKLKVQQYNQANSEAIYKLVTDKIVFLKLQQKESFTKKLWPAFAAAAAAIIMIVGIGLYNQRTFPDEVTDLIAQHDIPAGKKLATLILGNGKRIALADAQPGLLVVEAGISITKAENGNLVYRLLPQTDLSVGQHHRTLTYNTIEIPRGGEYQIVLADGTHVWLNSATSLKFPTTLVKSAERIVELNGEGYFKVNHNPRQPFSVKTTNQVVEDLGTEFNINAYADESSTVTTLLDGSLSVNSKVLVPGQQAVLKKSGNLTVQAADMQEALAWKNGDFVFRNDDFRMVMRKISRWYNVDIIYDASAPKNIPLGGMISRKKTLSLLLNLMEQTGAVHFTRKGRTITVSK